jgi:anti-sigma factor RsiW
VTDCLMTEVRDALPDLLHGRLSELDTATMKAHVESCAECRAELALLREVRSSAPMAPAIDAARIASVVTPYGAAAVIRNLPAQPDRKKTWRFALLAASAAIAVALGGVALNRFNVNDGAAPSVVATTPLTTSSSVSGAAIEPAASTPAASIAKPSARVPSSSIEKEVASLSFVGGTQDLSESELETLLAELDGMASMPAAEPQSVTLSVEDIEGGL